MDTNTRHFYTQGTFTVCTDCSLLCYGQAQQLSTKLASCSTAVLQGAHVKLKLRSGQELLAPNPPSLQSICQNDLLPVLAPGVCRHSHFCTGNASYSFASQRP